MTPTEPGWYWLRELDDDRWQIVRVDEDGEVHHSGSEIVSKVTDHHGRYGQWGPRIPTPDDPPAPCGYCGSVTLQDGSFFTPG